jgi:uncharacterized surface protein with fasciclin (FAS1) repeats
MKKIFLSFTTTAFFMIASIVTVKAQVDSSAPVTPPTPPPPAVATSDIIGVATGSVDHTTLIEAINTANVLKVFKLNGPFTVFAPTNAAFDKIPEADRKKLMKNKSELAKTLKYHVVGGTWNSTNIMNAIKFGNGVVELPTLSGSKLRATVEDGKVKLTDENGNSMYVTNADILATNGIVHIVDGVAMPMQQTTAAKQ